MKKHYTAIGDFEIDGKLATISGVRFTTADSCYWVAKNLKPIRIITTKSIGPEPRPGFDLPVIRQVAPNLLMNAVGLSNPGVDAWIEEIKQYFPLPNQKFLFTSIFGKNENEFVDIARKVAPFTNGVELNVSCPHVAGHGMQIGQDPLEVKLITKAVVSAVDVPVSVKLTPNVNNIQEIAKAAYDGGADAISAINTIGPGDNDELSNKFGGLSGAAIRPVALRCIRQIAEAVDLPLLGMGGIDSADAIRAFEKRGADFFGIGTAMLGMDNRILTSFINGLEADLKTGANDAETYVYKGMLTDYIRFKVQETKSFGKDIKILYFDRPFNAEPGQFVFVKYDGKERPFSVADNHPFTLAIKNVGCLSSKLVNVEPGEVLEVRGPYGKGLPSRLPYGSKAHIVIGGMGVAPLHSLAKNLSAPITLFLGAKNKEELLFLDDFIELQRKGNIKELIIATDDGSRGFKGTVVQALENYLTNEDIGGIFYNCGPPIMLENAVRVEKQYTNLKNIHSLAETNMKCGIGGCGSCSNGKGELLCVHGPGMQGDFDKTFIRDKAGKRIYKT